MPPFTHLELNSLKSCQYKVSGTKIAERNAVPLCAPCSFPPSVWDTEKTIVRICHNSHTMRNFFNFLSFFSGFAFFWVFLLCYCLPHSSYSSFTRFEQSCSLSYLHIKSAVVGAAGSPATYVKRLPVYTMAYTGKHNPTMWFQLKFVPILLYFTATFSSP